MALLAIGSKRSWQLFLQSCSGFQQQALEQQQEQSITWELVGKVKAPPHPHLLNQKLWRWHTALVQGGKDTSIWLPLYCACRFLSSKCKHTGMWLHASLLYLLCFWFEHTHAPHANLGIDFKTALCLFYRIYFGMALRLLFSLLGNKCDLIWKINPTPPLTKGLSEVSSPRISRWRWCS